MSTRRRYSGFGVRAFAISFVATTSAWAEPPPPGAANTTAKTTENATTSANAGSDTVRLKNGGLVRGKISELWPGKSVTIVSAAGKTYEFPMSEVSYAGSELQDPTAPPSTAPPMTPPPMQGPTSQADANDSAANETSAQPAAPATVHFESTPPGLTVHRNDGSVIVVSLHGRAGQAASFARLCTTPCSQPLRSGLERLALSLPGKAPIPAGSLKIPPGESTIRASYTNNESTRIAGGIVLGVSVVVGAVLLLVGAMDGGSCNSSGCSQPNNIVPVAAGGSVMIGGTLLGMGLASVSDVAQLRIFPGAHAPPAPEEPPVPRWRPSNDPYSRLSVPGLVLRGSF